MATLPETNRAANILKNWWLGDSFMFFSVSFREGKQTTLQKDMFISSHILVSQNLSPTKKISSWWFHPIWKILISQILESSPNFSVKTPKHIWVATTYLDLNSPSLRRFKFNWHPLEGAGRQEVHNFWLQPLQTISSWWFQPLWKILVKMGIFPK